MQYFLKLMIFHKKMISLANKKTQKLRQNINKFFKKMKVKKPIKNKKTN